MLIRRNFGDPGRHTGNKDCQDGGNADRCPDALAALATSLLLPAGGDQPLFILAQRARTGLSLQDKRQVRCIQRGSNLFSRPIDRPIVEDAPRTLPGFVRFVEALANQRRQCVVRQPRRFVTVLPGTGSHGQQMQVLALLQQVRQCCAQVSILLLQLFQVALPRCAQRGSVHRHDIQQHSRVHCLRITFAERGDLLIQKVTQQDAVAFQVLVQILAEARVFVVFFRRFSPQFG